MNVRFFAGTKAQYLSLPVPRNPLGLYFCEDTKELFWGDLLLTDGMRVVPTKADLPELSRAADGTVYYVTETRNGYILSPDRTEWLQTIYAPATDAYEIPESEIYNTVTTVGAVRDIESKIYSTIEDKIADIKVDVDTAGVKRISFAGVELVAVDGVFTIDRACARRALGLVVPTGKEDAEITIATEDFVTQKISEAELTSKDVDLTDFYTKTEVDALIPDVSNYALKSDVAVKANDIPFAVDKYVTNALGGFIAGESVKGLTVAELFTKILGLSDIEPPAEPSGIIETIIANEITMRFVNENDELVEIPFNLITYPADSVATVNDKQNGFYQVLGTSGEIIEAGYQYYSTPKEPWYIIALPEELIVATDGNVVLQAWDTLGNRWNSDATCALTNNYEEIKAAYIEAEIEPPVAPDGYVLWADLSESDPGNMHRFIIKE